MVNFNQLDNPFGDSSNASRPNRLIQWVDHQAMTNNMGGVLEEGSKDLDGDCNQSRSGRS